MSPSASDTTLHECVSIREGCFGGRAATASLAGDEFTLSYMEEHKFAQSDVSTLRVASENLVGLPYTCTEQDLQSVLSLTPQEAVTLARAARNHSGTDQGAHVSSEAVRRVLLGV